MSESEELPKINKPYYKPPYDEALERIAQLEADLEEEKKMNRRKLSPEESEAFNVAFQMQEQIVKDEDFYEFDIPQITQAVRRADAEFQASGGNTVHWVRDCFIPALESEGFLCVEKKRVLGERTGMSVERLEAECLDYETHAHKLVAQIRQLESDLAAARKEIERLTKMVAIMDDMATQKNEMAKEIERLNTELGKCRWHRALEEMDTENDRLREGLRKYGGHLGGCASPFTEGQLKCDCGYDAALLEEEK